jgi:hypothetical protein
VGEAVALGWCVAAVNVRGDDSGWHIGLAFRDSRVTAYRPVRRSHTREENVRTTHPVDLDKIKCGGIMSLTYYVQVTRSSPHLSAITVDDLDHGIKDIEVKGKELINSSKSADQFHPSGVRRIPRNSS